MWKILKIVFCFIIVDFFYFSTTMSFTHGLNTKEILAVVGIILFLLDLYQKREPTITREFLTLLFYSFLISLVAIFSSVFHSTQERAYTTYFMSMLVWLSAAFVVVKCIQAVHGELTIELIAKYIIAVSVTQGLIAVTAENFAPLDALIFKITPGVGWAKSVDRLYGLGDSATLDTGGIRFAIASVFCAHNIKALLKEDKIQGVPFYILAFLIIAVTGNMVARTTLVGTIVGLVYLLIYISPFKTTIALVSLKTWLWILIEALIVIILVSILYTTNEKFYSRTRFAFEGFFSLVEEGHWHTSSNEKLKSMYVFPDNMETWLIGDGYFVNPADDLNYLGKITEGFYKNSDVGYLRFIFFFGLIGLAAYSIFIIYAGRTCIRLNPGNTLLFIVLTSMTFIIWFKVATDCFFILCLFICLGYLNNKKQQELLTT